MRGDRYRDALTVVDTIERVRALEVKVLHTGHFGSIHGAEVIDAELRRLRDAVLFVHDATVAGMNEGRDVVDLMRSIELPEELAVGEGYGKVAWDVRAIWESYAGWFHHRATSELYAVRPDAVHAEVAALAGADALVTAGRARLGAGELAEALQLTEIALAGDPDHGDARALSADVHRRLLEASTNFWERAWLSRELERLQ